MNLKTADLCDEYTAEIEVAAPIFTDYGGVRAFGGKIVTLKIHEDNVLVRQAFEKPGQGQVLVIDGGGSLRCALVGDQLASLAHKNGWAGVIVYGCIRDAEEIGQTPLGVKALNTNPLKSAKKGVGEQDIPVTFAHVTFRPGHYVYADQDGIIVSPRQLI